MFLLKLKQREKYSICKIPKCLFHYQDINEKVCQYIIFLQGNKFSILNKNIFLQIIDEIFVFHFQRKLK